MFMIGEGKWKHSLKASILAGAFGAVTTQNLTAIIGALVLALALLPEQFNGNQEGRRRTPSVDAVTPQPELPPQR
jgi:hypothetical protein